MHRRPCGQRGLRRCNLRTVLSCCSVKRLQVSLHLFHVARSFLPCSPCRHEARTVSSAVSLDFTRAVWRTVSEDPRAHSSFLLIVRTSRFVTRSRASSGRYSDVPAYSQIYFRNYNGFIVTAAVYRGFDSELCQDCSQLTPPLNLPAPGRRQTLYVVFDFAESCVFSKQSPGPFLCDPVGLRTRSPFTQRGTPSPEVTGSICRVPKRGFSLAPVDSLLAYLCRIAVRSPSRLARGFSRQHGFGQLVCPKTHFPAALGVYEARICLSLHL